MKKYFPFLVMLLLGTSLIYFWRTPSPHPDMTPPAPPTSPKSAPLPEMKTTPPAQPKPESALETNPLPKSPIHPDEFSFEAKRGESYVIEINLEGNWEDGDVTLLAQGPQEKLLAQSLALARTVQSERFEILTTGTHLLRLSFETRPSPTYTINLKKVPTQNTFRPILKF